MISYYATVGSYLEALGIYNDMIAVGLTPNVITFMRALGARNSQY